jgi:hypothetical protein
MVEITVSKIKEFERLYFGGETFRFQRYGQAFCNHFDVTDTYLFYEEDTTKAMQYAWQLIH